MACVSVAAADIQQLSLRGFLLLQLRLILDRARASKLKLAILFAFHFPQQLPHVHRSFLSMELQDRLQPAALDGK